MEIEAKLNEDFIFYLGFIKTFLDQITSIEVRKQSEQWLKKLCGETFKGIHRKRCRNMYLAQLLTCMQTGKLSDPFQQLPHTVDLSDAFDVFKMDTPEPCGVPEWLRESDIQPDKSKKGESKGSTYLATRTLPGGQGALAYIALSLGEEEPRWLGGGEGKLDEHMEGKFKEFVPPETEMEKILRRRKDPREREKVLTFYDVLMKNIADELDGNIPLEQNKTVNDLVEQLVKDLTEKNEYGPYEEMDEKNRRIELLIMLFDRIKARRDKVSKREEVLDNLEEQMTKSFFDTSLLPQDKFNFPAAMWKQVINNLPNKKNMDKLHEIYPIPLIDMFLKLLANEKEEIAVRVQRRHENIISQMKKELRKESDKGKKVLEATQKLCEDVAEAWREVKEAHDKKVKMEQKNQEKLEIPLTEGAKLYEQMKAALFDTQRSVEEEAAKGKFLAAQINAVAEHTEQSREVNNEGIQKAQEVNMAIMRNIKRLSAAIKQHQDRINMIKKMSQRTGGGKKGCAGQAFFM